MLSITLTRRFYEQAMQILPNDTLPIYDERGNIYKETIKHNGKSTITFHPVWYIVIVEQMKHVGVKAIDVNDPANQNQTF